jgi:hypothetical protein
VVIFQRIAIAGNRSRWYSSGRGYWPVGEQMLKPFEKPISEIDLYLRLFITTSGGW